MRVSHALPILLAAIISAPLAAAAVFIEWSRIADTMNTMSPALWSARTFLAYFDGAVLLLLPASSLLCTRALKRAEVTERSRPR